MWALAGAATLMPCDRPGRLPPALHGVVHVVVLPLAEAPGDDDPVLLEPPANRADVRGVLEIVDHVRREDLLHVHQLDPVVRPQDLGRSQGVEGVVDDMLAVQVAAENAISIEIELLPSGTFARVKFPGNESLWNGNSSS